MRINEMTLSQPVYNPENGAFEAQARLIESGANFTYRVQMIAAPHATFDVVTKGLKAQALAMHRHATKRTQKLQRAPVRAKPALLASAQMTGAERRRIGAFLAA